MHAFLFDLDGTISDSEADIVFSANRTLELLGLPGVTRSFVRARLGYGPGTLIADCMGDVPEPQIERGRALFQKVYGENIVVATHLFPGMAACLDTLKAARDASGAPLAKLALVTNKSPALTQKTVQALNLERWFDLVWSEPADVPHKPDPFPVSDAARRLGVPLSHTVMIGDAETDILAGQRAGAVTVGVTWGFRSPEQVEALKPDHVVHEPAALAALLLSLRPAD